MTIRDRAAAWWCTQWVYPWSLLKEPRALSAIMAAVYLSIAVLIGLPTLLVLPGTGLATHYDMSLSIIAGLPLVLGGTLAAASLWGGAWFAERGGILLILGGLVARGVIIWALPYSDAATTIGIGEVATLTLALAARYFTIRGLDLNPREG